MLPIFSSAKIHDVLMLLKGIELYEYGFIIDLTVRPSAEVNSTMMRAFPRAINQVLTDDQETEYTLYQRGGGGGMGEWRFSYQGTPAINPDATRLTLEIPRLEFQEPMSGSGRLSAKSVLVGPWTFDLTLPSKEEIGSIS